MKPVLAFAAVCGALLASVASVNVAAGSRAAAPADMARALAARPAGDVLVASDTLHQRAWVKAELETRAAAPRAAARTPRVWIASSSTMGRVDTSMWAGLAEGELVNGWMGGFSVEDLETMVQLFTTSRVVPQWVVVGADTFWTANAAWKSEAYREWMSDYVAAADAEGRFVIHDRFLAHFARLKEQLSYERTADTLQRLRAHASSDAPLLRFLPASDICVHVTANEGHLRAPDGHYISCREKSRTEVDKLAREYLAANIHQVSDWRELDTARIERIEHAMTRLRALGSGVIVVGMPYHPVTYAQLLRDATARRLLAATDDALARVSSRTGATYLGLRDPERVSCSDADFDDSHHPRRGCVARVVAEIAAHVPAR